MTFFITAILIVAAIICAVLGFVVGSTGLLIAGATLSALAIIVLWRLVSRERSKTFVTDAPSPVEPDWDRPIRSVKSRSDKGFDGDIPEVAIANFDELLANEIGPPLETLSVEQLRAVIVRERAGLAREAVITRAQVLIDLTDVQNAPAFDDEMEPGPVQTRSRTARSRKSAAAERNDATRRPRRPRASAEQEPPEVERRRKQRGGPDLSL